MDRRSFFQRTAGIFVAVVVAPMVAVSRATCPYWTINSVSAHDWELRDDLRRVYDECLRHDAWFDIHTGEVY